MGPMREVFVPDNSLQYRVIQHSSLSGLGKMEQHALKNVNNHLNTKIYSYLETSGGQSSNPYLNVVHFLNTRAD